MKRTLVAGGSAAVALFLLVGCGSGDAPAPALAPVSTTDAPSSSAAVPPAPSTPSALSATPTPSALGAPSGAAAVPGNAPQGGAVAVPGGGAPVVPAPAAASPGNATAAYAARFCTALGPLVTFKQQNETPNLAGVTNGQQAKDLAVRLVTEGISTAQVAVRSVTDLGPAPDPQAAAGINALLGSLSQAITTGQSLLPQVQAVDPNNPMALLALASQAQAQLGTSQTVGLSALRSSTGPALGAALHTVPQCAPLGV